MLLEFEEGAIGEVHLDYLQRPGLRHLELYGELGRVTYDFGGGRLSWGAWGSERVEEVQGELWSAGRDAAYERQFQTLIDLIAGRTVSSDYYANGDDALATLAVASAALQSAEERRFVRPQIPTSV